MKLNFKVIIGIISILLIISVIAYINGWFSSSRDTHPPCNQLPNMAEASMALENHQHLADEIKALGDDITIEVLNPCGKDDNRGLIVVKYHSKSDRDAVRELLKNREGFGAPVHLEKR